jgi:hypothetical protein
MRRHVSRHLRQGRKQLPNEMLQTTPEVIRRYPVSRPEPSDALCRSLPGIWNTSGGEGLLSSTQVFCLSWVGCGRPALAPAGWSHIDLSELPYRGLHGMQGRGPLRRGLRGE